METANITLDFDYNASDLRKAMACEFKKNPILRSHYRRIGFATAALHFVLAGLIFFFALGWCNSFFINAQSYYVLNVSSHDIRLFASIAAGSTLFYFLIGWYFRWVVPLAVIKMLSKQKYKFGRFRLSLQADYLECHLPHGLNRWKYEAISSIEIGKNYSTINFGALGRLSVAIGATPKETIEAFFKALRDRQHLAYDNFAKVLPSGAFGYYLTEDDIRTSIFPIYSNLFNSINTRQTVVFKMTRIIVLIGILLFLVEFFGQNKNALLNAAALLIVGFAAAFFIFRRLTRRILLSGLLPHAGLKAFYANEEYFRVVGLNGEIFHNWNSVTSIKDMTNCWGIYVNHFTKCIVPKRRANGTESGAIIAAKYAAQVAKGGKTKVIPNSKD